MSIATVPAPDFGGFLTWYAGRRRRETGRSPAETTLRTKKQHLRTAARLLGCETEESLGTLVGNRQSMETLLDDLAARCGEHTGTMQVQVYALLDFARYAEAKGWAEEPRIYRGDVPAKNPAKPITVYTDDEVEAFVAAARGVDLRWWALLAFLADTGRRIGECLLLRWDEFKLEADPPYIELPFQKNGVPQYIPLGSRLTTEVFTSDNVGKLQSSGRPTVRRVAAEYPFPYTYSSAHKRFARFCERTGLPNRGFHNFRHTYITAQLVRGVPLQAVSSLVGHANPGVTQTRYNHLNALQVAQWAR
jgi:integrase/recombinase XerD